MIQSVEIRIFRISLRFGRLHFMLPNEGNVRKDILPIFTLYIKHEYWCL